MKREIWTIGYFPFTIGGRVHAPMITEVDVIEEMEVGKGFKCFSWKTPLDNLRISESSTGAIVGNSFEEVIKDVEDADIDVINKQMKEASSLLRSGTSHHMTNEEFFKLYKH